MADKDEGAEDGKPRRKRSMKPGPGVIDLDAADVTPEPEPEAAAESEPAAPEPEGEPRSPVGALIAAAAAGAAIGILAFVLLLTTELIPLPGADPALGSRVAALEKEVAEAPQAAPADDGAIRAELDALRNTVEELRNAPPPPPATDTALAERVASLEAQLADFTQTQAGSASSAALDELAARIDEIARRQAEGPPPDPGVAAAAASAERAAALASIAALESTIARGAPYDSALAALRREMPGASVDALAAGAERGLEPAPVLADRLAAALADAPPPPSAASGFVDRLAEGAKNLVRVRPVDGGVPRISAEDPWSARKAVAVRLDQGAYAAALEDWEKLDAAAREATGDEASALRRRLAADEALDELRAAALAIGAEPAP